MERKVRAAAARSKAAILAQMLQGNGLVFDIVILWNATDLAPETQVAIVSTVLVDKSAMFQFASSNSATSSAMSISLMILDSGLLKTELRIFRSPYQSNNTTT